jgi:transcriptional regulator with XRE-family HTH domain
MSQRGDTIGGRLRMLRKRSGLTVGELAHLASVPEPSLRRFELDRVTPSVNTLLRLAHGLGVSLSEFNGVCEADDGRSTRRERVCS